MIEIPDKVIELFGRSNLPAYWLVQTHMDEDSETGRDIRELLLRVDTIIKSGLNDQDPWVVRLAHLPHNSKLIMGLGHLMSGAVAAQRMEVLSADYRAHIVRPYDHPDLRGIKTDSNGLCSLREFEMVIVGLKKGSTVFEILPCIASAANSMYWASRVLIDLSKEVEVLVRLDPLMIQPASDYKPLVQKMLVYGRDLNWNEISKLRRPSHSRWMPDPGWQEDVEFTDLVWEPREDGIHFVCEELPKADFLAIRGSRYSHGVYDRGQHSFIHCDGAIRLYSESEHRERLASHVRNIGKIGQRIKIYQIDERVQVQAWVNLVGAFFVWNGDIGKYLGSPTGL